MPGNERRERMATTQGSVILRAGRADVARARARTWRRRVIRLFLVFAIVDAYLWYRYATHEWLAPSMPGWLTPYLPALVLVILLGSVMVLPVIAMGRSPHVMIRPED